MRGPVPIGMGTALNNQLVQRGAVEYREIGVGRPAQQGLEQARRCQRAFVIDSIETLDHEKIGLGAAYQVADIDALRIRFQSDPAITAPHRFDKAGDPQLIDDLHQVILRYAMQVGYILNLHEAIAIDAEIHQRAQRIVSVGGKSHRISCLNQYLIYCFTSVRLNGLKFL